MSQSPASPPDPESQFGQVPPPEQARQPESDALPKRDAQSGGDAQAARDLQPSLEPRPSLEAQPSRDAQLDDLRRRYRLDDEDRSGGVSGQPAPTKQERAILLRLASAGFELASFSLLLGGGGYLIDQRLGFETSYLAIVGLLLGFSLGFYRLIVLASRLS
ncbi:Putative F0F1-ATPase subunit Ca2+/Mg2+ transporter [Neorhodopirellula lusitana]|uniref:F0F1-ATPase subunit Ca2+/Mg2+ transporter n=1 Tax=Neorhodopirellula lusitana TaxID=445327 RepID=A0ABY1PV05_9BACT|nr:AtpZ/AtpI family protein [Neorhodopirellula lusitana]SMP47336.1 Putative F0F1-ATPase subunit Ca2+/Mg2+ transporter [Neorhodopirellula lusitana]